MIVGVDYGTTTSGISFVGSDKSILTDINVIKSWPGYPYVALKAPSVIAYAHEEKNRGKITQNQWGFQVTPKLRSYQWTKLLLDDDIDLTEFDDKSVKELHGDGFLALPRGKTAKDVCADYLAELYKCMMAKLEKELGAHVLGVTPLEIWVTMPAIWSDKAQVATRDAAKKAGFGSRLGDRLFMIPEPEAAALVAMKPHLGFGTLDPIDVGECILVCDCGGGTVDIATYVIDSVNPRLKFRELCLGMGGKCGSTAIDRNFIKWMEKKFGHHYTSLPLEKRRLGSKAMVEFERQKRNFRAAEGQSSFEIENMDMDAPDSDIFDSDEGIVKLSRSDMQSLFDPVMDDVIKLVSQQAEVGEKMSGRKLDRLILVGGFGDSDYLHSKLKTWCLSHGNIQLTCPEDCQSAIVRGAALRGLEGTRPDVFFAKRHYGWSWGEPFREGIDDEENAYTDDYNGKKYCRGRMHWVISKGQELLPDSVFARNVQLSMDPAHTPLAERKSTLQLFSCSFTEPPEREEHYSCQKNGVLVTDFADVSLTRVESKYNSYLERRLYMYKFEVEVRIKADDGVLGFKSRAYGQQRGNTPVTFD
ncbi:actin-like ATPase domain-containing protein [Stipitochalara longipes BDJ]|nr:actin-like ATPase domain-containing protein [Stipitochalara longipes BDJ]